MIVALLRHGVAEDAGPQTGFRDEPRSLTDDGRRRMQFAAEGIGRLGLEFDLVLTSPLARCVQTAEIVCEANGGEPVVDERLRPGMDADRLIDTLLEHPEASSVLVCGHQPDMSRVTADLVGGGDVEFKKGALAVLDMRALRPGSGVLRAVYPPSSLRRLGAG